MYQNVSALQKDLLVWGIVFAVAGIVGITWFIAVPFETPALLLAPFLPISVIPLSMYVNNRRVL